MFSLIVSLVLVSNVLSASPSAIREANEVRRQEKLSQIDSQREEFRERLAQIADERKQKIVENIAERITQVNGKWVSHWNNVLDRLNGILAKIEARDPVISTSAAETAIAAAQVAVDAQEGNTYEIEITDVKTLGGNVSASLKEFHEDLREVRALVKTAREEVVKVLRNLKANKASGDSEDEDEE